MKTAVQQTRAGSDAGMPARTLPRQPALRYSVLVSALAVAFSASAQTTPDSGAANEGQARPVRSGELQVVVVTADHRPVTVQKTAASITSVGGEAMREKGQTTLSDALQDVPAVEIQASPQGGQLFIRGVGTSGDSNWIDPSVSLMFDGVYSGRAERVFASMYDIDRVEVLRGPQGTLYGRNATGGSMNIISESPSNKLEGALNAQVGSYKLRYLDAALNVPVSEALALRLALMREKRDGYFSNGGGAADRTGVRLKALFKPSKDVSVLGTVDVLESKGLGTTTVPRAHTAAVPPFVNWPVYPANTGDAWFVDSVHPATTVDTKFTTYSLNATWNLGWGVVTVIPAYTHSNRYELTNLITGIAVPPGLSASTWEEDQYSTEVRLAAPASSKTKWVVGVYDFKSANIQTGTPPSSTGAVTYESYGVDTPAKSRAVFGQLTYPVSDVFRVSAGMRYTRDQKDYTYGIKSLVGSYNSGITTVQDSYNALTYKAGIEYDVAPASMVYAQVSTGYKAGGFSTTAIPPLAYAPEKLIAFELGSKNRFLQNRLQVNAELYVYRYKNLQAQYPDFGAASPNPDAPPGSTVFAQYVINAGDGINKGADIETVYRVTPDDELKFSLAWVNARYGDFAVPALSYLNGTPIINTPEWAVHFGYRHDWAFDNGAQLSLQGGIKFSDGYRTTMSRNLPGGDLNLIQGRYHKSNATLSYRPASDNWSASLWVRNIENTAQITNTLPFGRALVTDPRTVGINYNHKF